MTTGRLLKKDFELFKKECLKWIEIFGLKDLEWQFVFGDCDKDNRAEYLIHAEGRMCTIYLGEIWENDAKTNKNIKRVAFHEVAEVMLHDLRRLAGRDSSWGRVDEATHRIVRTLENVLFPRY